MAAFMLQFFHKLERKVSKGTWNAPCKWLKHKKDTSTKPMEMVAMGNQTALQESQGENLQNV